MNDGGASLKHEDGIDRAALSRYITDDDKWDARSKVDPKPVLDHF